MLHNFCQLEPCIYAFGVFVQSLAFAIFDDCTASATQAHIDVRTFLVAFSVSLNTSFGGLYSQYFYFRYLDVPCHSPAVFCSQYMLDIVIKHPHLHQTDATEGRTEKSPEHSWKMLIGYNLLQS